MQNGAFFLTKSLGMQTLLYTIFPLLLVMRPFQKPYHTENFWWIHGKRHYDVEQQILMAQLLRHEPTGDYFQVCLRWKGTANKLRQKYKFAESLQCSIKCYSYSPSVYDRRSVKKIIWIIYISSWSDWRVKECTKRCTWQIRKWYQTGKTNCFVSHQSNRIYCPILHINFGRIKDLRMQLWISRIRKMSKCVRISSPACNLIFIIRTDWRCYG